MFINSISRYLALIELLSAAYPLGAFIDNPVVEKFLYRGLSDEEYKLLPGIHRVESTKLENSIIPNKKYTAFSDGISILQRFIQEASPFVRDIEESDYLKWTMLAQHYGVPTRLLDWTINPLVALYFACADLDEKNGAVWIYHSSNYNKFLHENWDKGKNQKTNGEIAISLIKEEAAAHLPIRPMLLNPYYLDQRMAMQSSRFMVWGTEENALDGIVKEAYYMEIPSSEQGWSVYGDNQEKHFAYKVRVKAADKHQIMRQLESVGISGKTIYPGLEGIGRYIERHYRFDYNEGI